VRVALEEHFDRKLKAFKSFIDEKMIMVLGQMEPPSRVNDFMYLGTLLAGRWARGLCVCCRVRV
jgi:protein phosphatase slingshot